MKPSDFSTLKARLEPPWDDLRERRVLAKVTEARRAPSRRGALLAAAAIAVLAVVVGAVVLRPGRLAQRADTSVVPPSSSEPIMALADGSRAVLLSEAAVQVEDQRADRVRILQTRGKVRYEVRPDPAREFTVRAAGTVVRVRGTVFTVEVSERAVGVQVQRGHVEVDDGRRKRDLFVGESLQIPTAPSAAEEDASTRDSEEIVAIDGGAVSPPAPRATSVRAGTASSSAAALQAAADEARLSGDNAEAARDLERLVALHPRDAHVSDALFTLGRVERVRNRQAASARAFERCYAAAPDGPLAPDALAEAAESWSSAGADDAARSNAGKYLTRWPSGPASARMRVIAGL